MSPVVLLPLKGTFFADFPLRMMREIWATRFFLFFIGLLTSCGSNSDKPTPTSRDSNTSPRGEIRGEANFADLLSRYARGRPTRAAWAGYWWPFLEGGIQNAATKYEQFSHQSGALAWEQTHHGPDTPGIQSWWGHCNGWAAAAVLFSEPREARFHGDTVLSIGEQKALLSEVAQEVNADFFGNRSTSNDPSDPAFQDVFPNLFFLVLTNIVGKGQSLIMDRYTGDQIWNHPIAGYETAPVIPEDDLGADPSAPSVYRVMVTTTLWWLRDDVPEDHVTEPFNFQDGPSYDSRLLRYEVWLDAPPRFDTAGKLIASGNVILARQENVIYGGAWRTGNLDPANSHPDYLWIPYSVEPSSGLFSNPFIQPSIVSTLSSSLF